MIDFLKNNVGIDHTDEEEELVTRAATLAGHMDIDEAEDAERARGTIAKEVGVDVTELRDLLEPLEAIYAIADHCRTLAYMLGDEIVPSNVGTGYLARMVLRRTKRLCDTVDVDAPLDELVDMQADRLGYENRDTIRDIVRTELEKYRETLERGGRRVRQLADEYADRDEAIPTEELIELYDSHGIQPDMVAEIAREKGADLSVPDDFYSQVAARHGEPETADTAIETVDERVADLPETERRYYDDQERMEFEAMVLDVFEREDGYDVVLDRTLFYPEGGGQPADTGTLSTDDTTVDVEDVWTEGDVVVHRTDGDPGTGEFVRGSVDADRRRQLMRNHTATHIVGHAARQVLGEHVRQAGAQKGTERSRLDVRHYDRISRAEVKEIERIANGIVTDNVSVTTEWPERNDAEEQYGFDLYQGGIPPGEQIRLVHVENDTQACGGTHVARTGDIGTIKVLSTERVQDGVERLSFAAGEAAIAATQDTEDSLRGAAETFDVAPADVPETADRFFTEWKDQRKRIEELESELAEARAAGGVEGEEVDVGDTTAVLQRLDSSIDELRATANALAEGGQVAVLASGADGAQFVVAVPDGVGIDAGEVVSELAARVGGGGGGPSDFAQGGGPEVEQLDDALAEAPDVLRQVLNA